MPASPSHTITTSPARTAKFFSRISRKSIKATESQPHYSRLKLEGAIHSKLVDNRLLYDGAPLFHLALYQTQYPGLSFFITYQFDVHQFWRVLFHVLDHFLIEGIIDIIHSPFLATVLLWFWAWIPFLDALASLAFRLSVSMSQCPAVSLLGMTGVISLLCFDSELRSPFSTGLGSDIRWIWFIFF